MSTSKDEAVADALTGARPESSPPLEMGRVVKRTAVIGGIALLVILVSFASLTAYNRWADGKQDAFRTTCEAAVAAADWDELLETATTWRDWDPDDDDSLMFIAQALVDLERLDEAVETLGQVEDDYQGALEALAFRAEIQYSALNRPFDAEATWRRMVQIAPNANLPRQRLIYFYAMTLQRRKLIESIDAAIQAGCEPPEAYVYLVMLNTLNFSDGLKLVTRWRRNDPNNEILQVAQAIYAARMTPDNSIATFGIKTVMPGDRHLLLKCLETYPENLELLAAELQLAMFNGEESRVRQLLSQASIDAERDSRFWSARGWLLNRRGQNEQAAAALERALQLVPTAWQARWLLASVYRELDRPRDAETMSRIAALGKDLEGDLLERPNARDLTPELVQR
ncbi:MAG: hypothetical protein ACF8TS_18055, partial [Maioricimonas sp. JB049]